MQTVAAAVFALSSGALFYTFAGYAIHVGALARLKPPARASNPAGQLPTLTVVLAAHNESNRIRARLENLLDSDYPADRLKVIVVSDGSTDDTVAQVPREPRITVIARPQRSGKSACLNAAVVAAQTELIVFADARQRFERGAIRALARNFSDPRVGAVSGALEIASSASNTGAGVDVYWRLEKWIRASESRLDSAIGCTGAIYAIRRCLFTPLPPDTVLDDVVIPMRILIAGFRVLFENTAIAWDPQSLEPAAEQRRKRRTLAGNFQMLFRYPGWLLPWRNRLWWRLVAHKYLRLVAPGFLILAFLCNATLLGFVFFRVAFIAQCAFYLLAGAGCLLPRTRLAAIPAGFVFLNLMTLRAFWYYLFNRDFQRWEVSAPAFRSSLASNEIPPRDMPS